MLNNEKISRIQSAVKKNFETISNIINTLIGSFTYTQGHSFIDEYLKFVSWHGKSFLIAIDQFNKISSEEDKIIFLRNCEGVFIDSVTLLTYPDQTQIMDKTLVDIIYSPKLHETFFQINYSIKAITLCTKMMVDAIEEKPIGYKSSVFVEITEPVQNELDSKDGIQYLIKINDEDWSPVLLMWEENNSTFNSIETKPLVLLPGDMTKWMVNQIGEGIETNSINAVWDKLIAATPKIEDYTDKQLFEVLNRINDELSKRFPRTNLITHTFSSKVELAVIVKDMLPIPANVNPFKFDNVSSGIDISDQWILMYANGGKYSMYLCNNFSGQRISLTFVPKDLSLREPII